MDRRGRKTIEPDFDAALEALGVEELREFVREAVGDLEDGPRRALSDRLISRAARESSGFSPSPPSNEKLREIREFARVAHRDGYGDPNRVDDYLRQGARACLAGEHGTARAIFESLLLPIAQADIDLGQDELVDEVLTVSVHDAAAQYLLAVYATTPPEEGADALWDALDAVAGVANFWEPLKEMERVATGGIPALETFLPRWLARVEREPATEGNWENHRDRWLREVVERVEGLAGLERIARESRRPEALEAWCSALAVGGDWARAVRAYQQAAEMVGSTFWKGGSSSTVRPWRPRSSGRLLQAARRAETTLVRLVRWLGAGDPTTTVLRKRVNKAIDESPGKEGQQLGLLYVLSGDATAAADLLARAPGLGSHEEHPGHLLFPAFVGLLAESETSPSKTFRQLGYVDRSPGVGRAPNARSSRARPLRTLDEMLPM